MAFFGFLLTLISGGVLFSDSCKNASSDRKRREEAAREGRNIWTDSNRTTRLVNTNEPVYTHDNKIKSLKDGRVIIDRGMEMVNKQNAEAIAQAKSEGLKYCRLKFPEFSTDNRVRYFTELDTGRRYYLKSYGSKYYKYYYSKGHAGIASIFDDREDEMIELTEEEYEEWGGSMCEDWGKYYEWSDGTVKI